MKPIKKLAIITFVLINLGILVAIGILLFINNDEEGPSKSNVQSLKSLAYLNWHPVDKKDIKKKGVTRYNKRLAFNGVNIFNYNGFHKAYLMDMTGKILHTWVHKKRGWHHVEMSENGDLLGVVNGMFLAKLDWDSNVIWKSRMKYHHDVSIADNGDIYAITREGVNIPYESKEIPIINDYIVVLSSKGKIKKKISIFNLFRSEVTTEARERIHKYIEQQRAKDENFQADPFSSYDVFDLFHTNTVELIEEDIKGLAKKGNLLVCVRNLNIIAIVDVEKEEIVWRFTEKDLDWPHLPTFNNGNILIFDNGSHRNYSRVINLNPFTKKFIWEYTADPKESFFSETRGGAQILPNGNILITESNKSHVFEITPKGKIVWEYYGTKVRKKTREKRPIYRMTRLEPSKLKHFNLELE